jgi:hypothetical protein
MPNERKQTAQTNTHKQRQTNLAKIQHAFPPIYKGAIVFSELLVNKPAYSVLTLVHSINRGGIEEKLQQSHILSRSQQKRTNRTFPQQTAAKKPQITTNQTNPKPIQPEHSRYKGV